MRGVTVLLVLAPIALLHCERTESTASFDGALNVDAGSDVADGNPHVDGGCTPAKSFVGAAWPEADRLFHREPRWLGGDAAYSIEISPGRILWLFGDSFIATSKNLRRSESKFVRNSIAIQTGTDPTTASIAFYWRESGAPSSFFPEAGAHWYWPLHGARVGNEVVLFLNELEKSAGGLGFVSVGTSMLRIQNPDASPPLWTFEMRALPNDGRSHGVGVVVENGFLHSLTTKKSVFFDVELERWPLASLGDPSRFWNGTSFEVADAGTPKTLWGGGAPEFVTAPHCGEYLTIESVGFGATDLAVRRAPKLTGPWSSPTAIFHPEESDRVKPFVYAGKFHPALTGADVVATYASNSFDFAEVLSDMSLYFPRFVKVREVR